MARTRTSDPGRVSALHYAATQWQRHAKRLVYAYLLLLGLRVGGMGTGTVHAQDRQSTAVPCAACQVLSLRPEQVVELLPDRLSSARVLVRVPAGAAAGEWSPALGELRRLGAI